MGMKSILIRLLGLAVGLWVTDLVLEGITLSEEPLRIIGVAVIFGLVNAIIKPLVKILTFPITIITLGLWHLVINAGLFLFVDYLSDALSIESFWWALGGSLIMAAISAVFDKVAE
jgi:putative membrane protein